MSKAIEITFKSIRGTNAGKAPGDAVLTPYIKVGQATVRGESGFFYQEMIASFCGSVIVAQNYGSHHLTARTLMTITHLKIVDLWSFLLTPQGREGVAAVAQAYQTGQGLC